MSNLLSPYDLGKFQTVENCQKLSVNELVRTATKDLKKRIVEAHIEALGVPVKLISSKAQFNGERLWFACPICSKRAGTLFHDSLRNVTGCRKCLNLLYHKQKYKGMVEATL